MATTKEAPTGLVAPEFGPTGPELVRRHLGRRARRVVLVLAAVVVVALAVLIVASSGDGLTKLEHRSAPQFTLLHPAGDVRRVKAGPGEILRLRSGRGRLRMVVAIRRLDLPPYEGSVSGLLPILADHQAAALARELPGFRLRTEGKARVNDAPGYQLRYRAGPPSRRTLGTDVLLVPEDGERDGVLLRFRQTNPPGALDETDMELVKATRKAFRSFRFGLGRP